MNNSAIAALLGLNILVTGGLGFLIIKQNGAPSGAPEAGSADSALVVDLKPLEKPLAEVGKDIEQLTETVQRFSTSYVQYDFLKREMDRLAVVDQTIGVRAQATAATKTDENAEQVDEVIGKLSTLSQQVKGQLQTRRQTMIRLIDGLEKELSQISNTPLARPQAAQTTKAKTAPDAIEDTAEKAQPE